MTFREVKAFDGKQIPTIIELVPQNEKGKRLWTGRSGSSYWSMEPLLVKRTGTEIAVQCLRMVPGMFFILGFALLDAISLYALDWSLHGSYQTLTLPGCTT